MVSEINDAPVATSGIVGNTNEDQSVVITLTGTDIDGDYLIFDIDTQPENGSVEIEGNLATYTPNTNYNGSDNFIFSVSDGFLSSSAEIDLVINSVNDAPTLDEISDINFNIMICFIHFIKFFLNNDIPLFTL